MKATNAAGASAASAASASVTPSATQTIAFANPGAQSFGATPTLTATASSGLAVAFTSATTSVCTVTTGGALTFVTTGTCTISANQPGDAAYTAAATVTQSFAVTSARQTISFISTAPANARVGGTYAATANATSGLPVTLAIDASSASICAISGGVVSFTGAGICRINADQAGNANYSAAQRIQQSMTVSQTITTTTLTATPAAPAYGASVTLAAQVAPAQATGTVTFKDGGAVLGTANLSNGAATITTTALSAGAHSIVAEYGGDIVHAPSASSAASVSVQRMATSVALAVSSQSPIPGAPVTFTATLTPQAASGTITFMDGATALGSVALANGVARFSTASLTTGAHAISAVYAGDANHAPATSPAQTVTVSSSLAIVTSAIAQPVQGQPYAQSIATTGGLQPVTCSVSAGQLPPGLSLNSATCALSGTPSGGTNFAFTITARDAAGSTATREFAGTVTRTDPTAAATVRGLITAQATQTMRFARAQTNFVHQRLERLHEESEDCVAQGASVCMTFSNGFNVTQSQAPRSREEDAREAFTRGLVTQATRQPPLAADTLSGMAANDNGKRSFGAEQIFGALPSRETVALLTPGATMANAEPAKGAPARKGPAFTPMMLNFWTAGSIEIGRYSTQQQNFGAKIDDKFRSNGLAFGVDTTVRPGLKAGLAIGFGADTTEIGADGSRSSTTSANVTLYASQKIAPSLFLDGLVGYAGLRFDARRFEPNTGTWLTGSRRGEVFFESVVLTSEQKWGAFRFAPYASLTAIQASLDAYAERGDANWALSYAKTRVNSLDAAAGLRLGYDIPMGWGVLTPILRLQYQHMFAGSMRQGMSYSIDPATLFTLEDSTQTRWMVNGAAGFMLKTDTGLQGGLEATASTGGGGRRGIGMRANVRAAF